MLTENFTETKNADEIFYKD